MNTELVNDINQSLELSLKEKLSAEELREQLAAHINHLINTDFEKLVFYLYRIDVDETKMRRLLDNKQGEDSAYLLADLIIERQIQKIENRKNYKHNNSIADNEKW